MLEEVAILRPSPKGCRYVTHAYKTMYYETKARKKQKAKLVIWAKIAEQSDEHFQVKWEYKKSSVWFGVQRA